MTFYNDFSEAQVPALPQELHDQALALFQAALAGDYANGLAGIVEVNAGHAYDRKSEVQVDTLGGHRNPSYGRENDDVVLQVTILVTPEAAAELITSTKTHYADVAEAKRLAELAAIDADMEALIQRRAELSA